MEDYSNITGGLKIASQIPLDVKTFVLNENTLSYLGADDNLAFTYYDNLKVFCSEERTTYEWREVGLSEQNTGLIASDFLYPSNSTSFGIDYSGKYFNFFLIRETGDSYSVYNIGATGLGVYKDSQVSGVNTQFNLKKILIENSDSEPSIIKSFTQTSDNLILSLKTLSSANDSLSISGTTNNVEITVNALWLNNFLSNYLLENAADLCAIVASCTGGIIIQEGAFGYHVGLPATACSNSSDDITIPIYRNALDGYYAEATILATDAALTILASAGYYAELDVNFGAIVVRYWDGAAFVGVPAICGAG